jgi:hypothetical protein
MHAVVDDSKDPPEERSETDKMVDGMDFGELCSDFECISSPYVESTARQVARDILELREDNRAFNCYAVSVKYKVLLVAGSSHQSLCNANHGSSPPACVSIFRCALCLPLAVPVHTLFQDPLRTFVGREKYRRPLWITKALENPVVVRIDQIDIHP